MTQPTDEQREQMQAAAERVAVKLHAFHDELTPDEQAALHFMLGHGAAGADGDEDVAGFYYSGAINPANDWCGTCRNPMNPSQLGFAATNPIFVRQPLG